MKVGSICFLVLLNMVLFVSCSENEDDSLNFYDSSGTTKLTEVRTSLGENWIRVGGGDGGYTVSFDGKEIADVSISNDVIKIRAYQSGESEITITDRTGEQITVPFYIYAKERVLSVELVDTYVESEDEHIRAEIKDEVGASYPVLQGGSYILKDEKWADGRYEGELVVYPGTSKDKKFTGTFIWDETVKNYRLTFKYNDRNDQYDLPIQGLPDKDPYESVSVLELSEGQPVSREMSPFVTMYMGVDLTPRYPRVAKVSRVERISFFSSLL